MNIENPNRSDSGGAKPRRLAWLLAALASTVLLCLLWLASQTFASIADAKRSGENLAEARNLAKRISTMASVPPVAALKAESPSRLTSRITAAAADAGIQLRYVTSLDPQSPSRIGRSDYTVRATAIVVEDINLPSLSRFCSALTDPSGGLTIRDLTLDARTEASSTSSGESWDARMTLTQLIFSPISDP